MFPIYQRNNRDVQQQDSPEKLVGSVKVGAGQAVELFD